MSQRRCDDCDAQHVDTGHPIGRRRWVCARCNEKYSEAWSQARLDRKILIEQMRQGLYDVIDLREGKEGTIAVEGADSA